MQEIAWNNLGYVPQEREKPKEAVSLYRGMAVGARVAPFCCGLFGKANGSVVQSH